MRIRRVTSLREFDALAPLWREITNASGQVSPFLSHDWFACCWRAAGPYRRREVWLLEDSAGPIAAIPLIRRKAWVRGLPVRVLQFLDSPETPFAEFPVARGFDEVMSVLLDSLRVEPDWDLFVVDKLPTDSMALKAMASALPGQFLWAIDSRALSPMLTVSGTWEQFARQRTEQFREECARLEAGMQRAGTVTLEEHRAVDPDGPVFAEVRDVCEQCLRDPHGTLKATMQGMPRFFQDLAPRASAKGWLHLWVLRLAGRAIAAEYQLGADGSLYALRTDCDSSLGELTPDACLRLRIIQSLFEERHAHQYYVAHDSSALDWATGLREAVGLHIYAPSSYGRLLHGIETQLVPFARRWRFASAARCA